MVYLLTYDGYMKEEKLQEICPSAKLFMQCGLKDCSLEFHRFYETAMPTLEVGDEIVPAVDVYKRQEFMGMILRKARGEDSGIYIDA